MSWKDSIQAATFRGVPFEVPDDEMEGGRRNATHEYPGRDEGHTEDMGRKVRSFSVEGFVVGDDYMARRDRLIEALEAGGVGLLVHPQYGRMEVNVDSFRVVHSIKSMRTSMFRIQFVKSGKAVTPGVAVRTQDDLFGKADVATVTVAEASDKRFSVQSVPSYVTDSSHEKFVQTAELIGSSRTAVSNPSGFIKRVAELAGMGAAGMATLSVCTALVDLLRSSASSVDEINDPETRMNEMLALSAQAPVAVEPVVATAARKQEAENANALSDFVRQAAASEAARSAAAVEPETAEDARRMSDNVASAIDGVLDTTTDDDVFRTFSALRVSAVRDLALRARKAKQVRSVTPGTTMPALVVAHNECDGGARDVDTLLSRNTVPHPGFVAVQPLEVIVNG